MYSILSLQIDEHKLKMNMKQILLIIRLLLVVVFLIVVIFFLIWLPWIWKIVLIILGIVLYFLCKGNESD